jgi:hypothetical protein
VTPVIAMPKLLKAIQKAFAAIVATDSAASLVANKMLQSNNNSMDNPSLRIENFYETWHGHDAQQLELMLPLLRGPENRPCVFLAGDSSLDNKAWFNEWGAAYNGYENILFPPQMKKDIAYWLNKEAETSGRRWFCLNCAVEESALIDRSGGRLLHQDIFIRDHLMPHDILTVSVGGNDIVLKPTPSTIRNMRSLIHLWNDSYFRNESSEELDYFIRLFRDEVKSYVENLVAKTKPRKVVICMIYYPSEKADGSSWADGALNTLEYDAVPQKLQSIMQVVFQRGTKDIRIAGSEVVALPLYEILNGKILQDYVARVEPSAQGGEKLANALCHLVENENVAHAQS